MTTTKQQPKQCPFCEKGKLEPNDTHLDVLEYTFTCSACLIEVFVSKYFIEEKMEDELTEEAYNNLRENNEEIEVTWSDALEVINHHPIEETLKGRICYLQGRIKELDDVIRILKTKQRIVGPIVLM